MVQLETRTPKDGGGKSLWIKFPPEPYFHLLLCCRKALYNRESAGKQQQQKRRPLRRAQSLTCLTSNHGCCRGALNGFRLLACPQNARKAFTEGAHPDHPVPSRRQQRSRYTNNGICIKHSSAIQESRPRTVPYHSLPFRFFPCQLTRNTFFSSSFRY